MFNLTEGGVNVVYERKLQQSESPEKERLALLKTWEFDSSPFKAAAKYFTRGHY